MSSRKRRILIPRPRQVATKEIQLIDRVEEMQILREAADNAVNGQGGVTFLHGEAGIGKTRLARELGAYARSRGMQVLIGRCPALFRMDGVPPYVLWEEVIRGYLEVCTPEQLSRVIGSYPVEIAKLVPEINQKLRTFPQSFQLSPEHGRDRLFEAVSQFVTNISREKPLLVVLDDLQWTDQSSLLLLHYLARGAYRESLLLLGAYRDTYVDDKHPLSPVLTELNRERLLQSVSLGRLSFANVSEMIQRLLEQDDIQEQFCRLVYEKTRGNPFFIEEVIKSLKEEKIIQFKANRWKIKEVSSIQFPKTVKSVIKRRISRLDDDSQRIMTLASFIGKDFTFKALLGVTNLEEEKLLDMLEEMTKSGFIKQKVIRGKDVCSFTDIIVRDVVHEEVSALRRKKLHGTVGQALEKVYSKDVNEHLGELALHFLESGDQEKALDYFLKAGENATNIYANNEAASYFHSAFQILKEKEDRLEKKGNILEKLGDIKGTLGEPKKCIKYWDDALQLRQQLNETEKISRLHRKMANVLGFFMGDMEKAKEHQEEALKILESEPESVELAMLYAANARLLWHSGEIDEAYSWAEKALRLGIKLEAFEVIAEAYTNLALVTSVTGDRQKTIEYLEKALQIALEKNYIESALRIYNNLANEHSEEESERSVKRWEEGFELAKKAGHVGWISWMGSALSGMYANSGNMSKALQLAEQSMVLNRKTRNLSSLTLSLGGLGYIYQILGEWDKSEEYYKEAIDVSEKLDHFQARARSYGFLGWLYLAKGEYAETKELYEKAMKISEDAGASSYVMAFSRGAIWAYVELGEFKKARTWVDKLQKFANEKKQRELIAGADALKAMLLREEKKWKESIEHFEKSLDEYEALEAKRWDMYTFAKVLYEYSKVYLKRDLKNDREKARSLLTESLEIFQKLEARRNIEEIQSKLTLLETGREISEPEVVPVEVPDTARLSYVTTGYEGLDGLLPGGIPYSYAVILTSPSYDERDLLIKGFLEVGAKQGGTTFFITIDPDKAKTHLEKSNFYLFICNPQADKIIEDQPDVFKLKGVESLTDINIALASAFRRLGAKPEGPRRACIEIISDVLLQHQVVQTRKWLNSLIPQLKSKGFTTLAVIDPEIHSQQEVRAITGIFEGEINIYEKKIDGDLGKFLQIKKLFNQQYSGKEILLEKEMLQR